MTTAQTIDTTEGQSGGGHPRSWAGDHFGGDVRGDAARGRSSGAHVPATSGAAGARLGLLALVPLVKVAWAEGRVTRRERALISAFARRYGVEAGGGAHALLSGWLETQPPEEFFDQSFARLRSLLRALPEEARDETTLDLLSLCTSVAGVSGGGPAFPAGGPMVCDEEVVSVKGVAAALRSPLWADFAELLDLSEATGVTDVQSLRGLREVGFTPQTGALLPLVPLVETAWAEGHVSAGERKAVLTAARLQGIRTGSPAHEMLVRLLDERPTPDFFSESFRALQSVMHILPPDLREVEHLDLLDSCERVARASVGNAIGDAVGHKVCAQERRLLDRLASELGQARAPNTEPISTH